jgi:hypothetical protein
VREEPVLAELPEVDELTRDAPTEASKNEGGLMKILALNSSPRSEGDID